MIVGLVLASLMTLTARPARAGETAIVRRPRFLSMAARQIIVEATDGTQFWFERCAWLPEHDRTLADQLNSSSFDHCATVGEARPNDARSGVERALNQALVERRRELGDPSVARWAVNGLVQGSLFGGLLAVTTRRLVRRGTLTAAVAARDMIRFGGLFGVATSASQAWSALKRRGTNQPVLGLFDPEMPNPVYVLDHRSDDSALHARTLDLVATVLDHVTRTYVR